MKWFGESWGAPICDVAERVERPAADCMYCARALVDGDRGVVMPFAGVPGDPPWLAAHLDCFLESLGIKNDRYPCRA